MQFFSKKSTRLVAATALAAIISGCAGTSALVSNRDLNVKTQMSSSVFLQPTPPSQHTAYVQVTNTSGQPELDGLQAQIATDLQQKGYRITDNPNSAHYIIQANVLQAGQVKPNSADNLLGGGFGGAVAGAGIGALTSGGGDISATNTIAGALIGAAAGAAINAAFQDVSYTVTTDVQISERTAYASQQTATLNTSQGDSGSISTVSKQSTNWQRYQTRVVSSAEKVNLKFPDAAPALINSMANSIAGMF